MNQPTWMLFVTFGIALLGAVLGVINTWRALWRDRVRLRVVLVLHTGGEADAYGTKRRSHTEFVNGLDVTPDGMVGVRVTNLGFLEVTIGDLGFTPSGFIARRLRSRLQRASIKGDAAGEKSLPKLLKPRESMTIWVGPYVVEQIAARLSVARRVYATTDCGVTAYGTSRLFRLLRRRVGAGGERL